MAEGPPRLSLVAQFDDLARNRCVLTTGIETGEAHLTSAFAHMMNHWQLSQTLQPPCLGWIREYLALICPFIFHSESCLETENGGDFAQGKVCMPASWYRCYARSALRNLQLSFVILYNRGTNILVILYNRGISKKLKLLRKKQYKTVLDSWFINVVAIE